MKDQFRTNQELLKEISALKQEIQELEQSESERKRVQKELTRSEEKFRKAFYTSPDSVNINRLEDGMYISINPGFTRILGYTEEEIIGKTSIEYNIWDNIEDRQRLVAGLKKDGEVINLEASFRIKSGDIVRGLMSASIIDLDGVPHILSITRDITDRKRAEEALRESEKQYRLLADNANDVIFVLDMNLKYTYVSPSIKILRGYEPDEVFKQPASETLTPSSWDLAMRTVAEVLELEETEQKEPVVSRTLELEMFRKDGTTLWTEVKLSLLRDENQQPAGILGVTRDITIRKQAEEVLHGEKYFVESMIQTAQTIVLALDTKGHIVKINPYMEDVSGYTAEEVQGKDWFSTFIPERFRNRIRAMFLEAIDDIQTRGNVNPIVTKDGCERIIEWYDKTLKDEKGNTVGLLSIGQDITAREKAEKELQQTLESLQKAVSTTIQVMVSAVEVRDPYTAGHQLRVADLAHAIATEMGLSKDRIESIRMAGSIHDIGKLSIPAEILSKPTKLSEIEFSLIKEHSLRGYEMLKDVESPWPLAEIVYQHHERMDGSGYPRNLKGDEIIMEARIMTVADVVEAMASHRPYRASLGIEAGLKEIEGNKGTLYDNDVVDACLRLFREEGFKLKGS